MNRQTLTVDHLEQIVSIYEANCGFGRSFKDAMCVSSRRALELIKMSLSKTEFRIGSMWEGHSKIYFGFNKKTGELEVSFDSNFDPHFRDTLEYDDAYKHGEAFVQAVSEYIASQK